MQSEKATVVTVVTGTVRRILIKLHTCLNIVLLLLTEFKISQMVRTFITLQIGRFASLYALTKSGSWMDKCGMSNYNSEINKNNKLT